MYRVSSLLKFLHLEEFRAVVEFLAIFGFDTVLPDGFSYVHLNYLKAELNSGFRCRRTWRIS